MVGIDTCGALGCTKVDVSAIAVQGGSRGVLSGTDIHVKIEMYEIYVIG